MVMHRLAHYSMMTCFLRPKLHICNYLRNAGQRNSNRMVEGECGILQHETCVDRSVADIVNSRNNSSVVSDVMPLNKAVSFPPNKTTTLKLAPLPNTTAE